MSAYGVRIPVGSGAPSRSPTSRSCWGSGIARASCAVAISGDDSHAERDLCRELVGGKLKFQQLTHQNDALFAELQLGTTTEVSAKSKDGTEVHGLLTTPPGYVAGTKIPMLLRIHGGPNGQDQHQFAFERQWFAANGYAVLAVNYRGSAGRGAKYSRSIWADWGHYEVDDLQAMVDQVVKMGVADPNKLGVGGWSYGGILTDYMIASDTRFKAATSGAGTAFTVAFYGTDQYIIQYDYEIGPPWDPEGVGDLPEDLVPVPARRQDQDADAVSRRREGLQRAGAGRAADVPGAAQPRHRHAARDLPERVPRHHPPELRARPLRALPGVVRVAHQRQEADGLDGTAILTMNARGASEGRPLAPRAFRQTGRPREVLRRASP